MPFYEYLCGHCGRHTELLQKISDPPATDCPHCGAAELVKQVSAAGFRLKGGGWYETDFKNDGKRNLAGDSAEPASTASGEKSDSSTSASKPAAGAAAAGDSVGAKPAGTGGSAAAKPATTAADS
ncbi:MAG: zinc ribbon domain-containing protein [Gammaproteobacteria bacterium]|nr:zinc ribbon domain-containing protein [Gammaproteobacteria bacterium]